MSEGQLYQVSERVQRSVAEADNGNKGYVSSSAAPLTPSSPSLFVHDERRSHWIFLMRLSNQRGYSCASCMGEVCLELLGGPALVDGEALSHTPGTQLYIKHTRAIFDAGIYLAGGSRDSSSRRFCFKFTIL